LAISALEVIEILALAPHPESGHYRETWREQVPQGERGAGSAICYLRHAG